MRTHDTVKQWPEALYHQAPSTQEQLIEKIQPLFLSLLEQEKIPLQPHFTRYLDDIYIPMCGWLSTQQKNRPLVIGLNGAQGSGKSTLTKILSLILQQGFNKSVVAFSIDDLYKTKNKRQQLARDIHPLLATRGVPGTHDAELGISILEHLTRRLPVECLIPVFDKAKDDRTPVADWIRAKADCDIIIFEGWCLGCLPQHEDDLHPPINSLEEDEDRDQTWRRYVNQQIKGVYSELFAYIDLLIMLKIPDFNKVFEWRSLQEKKLRDTHKNTGTADTHLMKDSEIRRFIMHYERISRHLLKEMPERARILLELGDKHLIENIIVKE